MGEVTDLKAGKDGQLKVKLTAETTFSFAISRGTGKPA
jgi:uncharacterized cupredoxin-like copper-binding protein